MADLLTLKEYKNYAGIPVSDTSYDTQLTKMLAAASQAIRNYTGRSFDTALATVERQFEYDGHNYLEIDDAVAVSSVAFTYPSWSPDIVLDAIQWRAMPFNGPVFYYIMMPGGVYGASPEMGFMRNLDVAAREGRLIGPAPLVKVNATWGWPAVPEDVKQATLWTMEDWGAGPAGSTTPGVTSEAIEGYARSFGGRQGANINALMGVPNRAKDVLAQYQRVLV